MNSDQRSSGNDHAASQPMGIRQSFREIRKGIVVMWWGFFDWVAVVSWKALVLVSFLGLILGGGIFKLPDADLSARHCPPSSSRWWRVASAGPS